MSTTTSDLNDGNQRPSNDDIQGRFLRLPYDWRLPSWSKISKRLWQPGGRMLVPKVFGWGWAFNLAHPGSWLILAALLATACAVIV